VKKGGQKPMREADLKPPNQIAGDELNELFDLYSIEGTNRAKLKDFMQDLITQFRDHMQQQRSIRTRGQDRRSIQLAAKRIEQAKDELARCGAEGRQILRLAAKEHLSTTFSLHWLRCNFPDDEFLPDRRRAAPAPSRNSQYGADADTLQALYYFSRQRGPELIAAGLDEIYGALARSNDETKSKGGRTPTYTRHSFLMHLAVVWRQIGRGWTAQGVRMAIAGEQAHFSGLDFRSFCENIFQHIGWSSQGLDDAIKKAIADVVAKRLA
jgi:hypothetical protein